MSGRIRVYLHADGRYFTLCPDDGLGDVVIPMPEYHPAENSDYNRLRIALDALYTGLGKAEATEEAGSA